MIPSRPLDLGGILGETIRIIKRIFWKAALFLVIFTVPGLIILTVGFEKTIDGAEGVAQKYTSVSPEAPILVRDYFLEGLTRSGSLWIYRLQYPAIFKSIDSVTTTILTKYADSAQEKISARLDSISNVVVQKTGMDLSDMIIGCLSEGFAWLLLGILIYMLGLAATWSSLFDLSSRAFEERPIILGPIFRLALTRSMWLLIVQYLLIILVMFTALILVVAMTSVISPILGVLAIVTSVPGMIYTGVRIMFSGIALVSEESGPLEAIKRSVSLTTDMFWRIFGISLICGILYYIIAILITQPVSFLIASDMDRIVDFIRGDFNINHLLTGIKNVLEKMILSGLVTGAITVSLFPAFLTTFYYDLRTRREGALEYPSEHEKIDQEGF